MSNHKRFIYEVLDEKTMEVWTGDYEEIARRTNMSLSGIYRCALYGDLIEKRYRISRKNIVYKVTLPWGKVKHASTGKELEEIFGYSQGHIWNELAKNNYTSAFGCKVERVVQPCT